MEERDLKKLIKLIKKYNNQRRETLNDTEKTKLFMMFDQDKK